MSLIIIPQRFAQRWDTAANWASKNPVLWAGEIGFESDTEKEKRGDGISTWNDLPYIGGSSGGTWGSITGTLSDQTDLQEALDELGIALAGREPTYADLPSTLGSGDSGKAYLVDADELIYIWNGTAFPANGDGVSLGGSGSSISADAQTIVRLNFNPTKFDRYFRPNTTYRTDHGSNWTSISNPVVSSDGLGMDFKGNNGFKMANMAAGATQVPVGTLATIDAWVRLSTSFSGAGYVFGNRNGASSGFALRVESTRKVIIFDAAGASATSTVTLALDTPVFLRAIATTTQWQLFAGGTQIASFTRTSYSPGTDFELGRQSSAGSGVELSLNGVIYSAQMRIGVNLDGSVVPSNYDLV